MKRNVKDKLSWRQRAERLGVNHSHLYRVVKGQRQSAALLKRYKKLMADTPAPQTTGSNQAS